MGIIISVVFCLIFVFAIHKIIKSYRDYKNDNEKAIFWIFVAIFSFPTIVFYIDYFNIPSKLEWTKNMNSNIWLECIVTYFVTILSTIIAAFVTIRSVKMSIEAQDEVRIEENKKKALPLLKIEKEDSYDYRYKYLQFECLFTEESKERKRKDISDIANVTIKIKNVGMRELYDLYIGDIKSTYFKESNEYCHYMYPIIYKDDSICINLSFYEMGNYDNDKSAEKYDTLMSPITFNCYFKDCYKNWYYQTLEIWLMYQIVKDTPITERALNISISDMKVLSAPVGIEEQELPWKNGKDICDHS